MDTLIPRPYVCTDFPSNLLVKSYAISLRCLPESFTQGKRIEIEIGKGRNTAVPPGLAPLHYCPST